MKFLVFIFLVVAPVTSVASIAAQHPRVTLSRDQTKLLVMFSPLWLDSTGNPIPEPPPIATLPNGQTVNLRDTFQKCGVYDAATLAPVCQVDWFEQEWNLLLSDDFRYAARRNIYGASRGWAMGFYDRGTLIQSYSGAQLLTGMKRFIPFTSADWHYRWYEDFKRSPDGAHVLLSTVRRRIFLFGHLIDLGRQEFYTFDLATGAIVEQRTTGVWVIWAYAAAALILIIAPLYVLRFLWQRSKSSLRRRGFPVTQSATPNSPIPVAILAAPRSRIPMLIYSIAIVVLSLAVTLTINR